MNFILNFFERKITCDCSGCADNKVDPKGNISSENYKVNIGSIKNKSSGDRRNKDGFFLSVIPDNPCYGCKKKRSCNNMNANKYNRINMIFITNNSVVIFN